MICPICTIRPEYHARGGATLTTGQRDNKIPTDSLSSLESEGRIRACIHQKERPDQCPCLLVVHSDQSAVRIIASSAPILRCRRLITGFIHGDDALRWLPAQLLLSTANDPVQWPTNCYPVPSVKRQLELVHYPLSSNSSVSAHYLH